MTSKAHIHTELWLLEYRCSNAKVYTGQIPSINMCSDVFGLVIGSPGDIHCRSAVKTNSMDI